MVKVKLVERERIMVIYLDNAATTKVCDEAASAITGCLQDNYGNPSSLHGMGIDAEKIIDNTRKIIGMALACEAECIYFTSGATESNNLAVLGVAGAYGKRKRKIITTSIEHPSVSECMNKLEEDGFEVVRISPNSDGEFDVDDFINAVDGNTCMVSAMLVNNENGYTLPIGKIFKAIKRKNPDVITHCDAVQGFMKTPIKVKELNADLISISGHKIYSAKGIGAFYIKKGIRLKPICNGGGQEKGLRSGTESVPLIAGLGASVEKLNSTISCRLDKANELREYFLEKLDKLDGVAINLNDNSMPYIINVSIKGIRSEIMLHFLEEKGIYVSSGSACSKGAKSNVLKEFGLGDGLIDSAIRISTSFENTVEDMEMLVNSIAEAKKRFNFSK